MLVDRSFTTEHSVYLLIRFYRNIKADMTQDIIVLYNFIEQNTRNCSLRDRETTMCQVENNSKDVFKRNMILGVLSGLGRNKTA